MRMPFRALAISSAVVVLMWSAGFAETRPRYGETLHIETRSAAFLNPGSYGADDSLSRLIFDTLTMVDAAGNLEPGLATAWQADASFRRWQFWLRRNVTWHDGATLSPAGVAQAVNNANPE